MRFPSSRSRQSKEKVRFQPLNDVPATEPAQSRLREPARVPVLVIHGGAGTMSRERSTPDQRELYREALREALLKGYEVLKGGGEAMDAAVAAVGFMEDCPFFNCARGAVFNVAGKNELEASIMLSKPPASHPTLPSTRRGFGLSLLTSTRNPAHAAQTFYLNAQVAPHVFLSGSAAEDLAESLGEQRVDPSYFFTEARWREHRRGLGLPEEPLPLPCDGGGAPSESLDQMPTGTVGAVALDVRGCISVVTSTGGRTNKLVGRIGDTPHMGAGFWAEEWIVRSWWKRMLRHMKGYDGKKAFGASGTGDGDYFIRFNAAASIAGRMKYKKESLDKAVRRIVIQELGEHNGLGGVVALDERGNASMCLNCPGMYRGLIRREGVPQVAIFADEELE